MENARFLHKLARLRGQLVDVRAEARLAHEWWWVSACRDLIDTIDREVILAAQESAKERARMEQQLSLVEEPPDQAS